MCSKVSREKFLLNLSEKQMLIVWFKLRKKIFKKFYSDFDQKTVFPKILSTERNANVEEDLCVEKYTRWVKSDWGQMAQSNIFIVICTGYLHWGAH